MIQIHGDRLLYVTAAVAIIGCLLCFWEFCFSYYENLNILQWRSFVQWVPQGVVTFYAVFGVYIAHNKAWEDYHLRVACSAISFSPFVMITFILSTIRTSFTICCCTRAFCLVNTYNKRYFVQDSSCYSEAERCTWGYWRLLFNFFGTFCLLVAIILVIISQLYKHSSIAKRRLEYYQFCQDTATGIASASVVT